MNRLKKIILFFILVVQFSCNSGNLDIQKKKKNGLQYGFYSEHKDKPSPQIGEGMELKLKYYTESDSLLFSSDEVSENFRMECKPAAYRSGSIEYALRKLRIGDSARFYILADSFFIKSAKTQIPLGVKKGSKLRFEVKLVNIIPKVQIEKERAEFVEKQRMEEQKMIDDYLKNKNIQAEPDVSGMFFIEIKKGKGKKTVPQRKVLVHYTGSFLSGEIFDSSFSRSIPLEFTLGIGEVIPGWDIGISKMNEGGKAKLIIPAHLAYGEKGYKALIPPFSTLVFEVEVIKVE